MCSAHPPHADNSNFIYSSTTSTNTTPPPLHDTLPISFTPANQAVTINGGNQTAVNFTASAVTFRISGSISNDVGRAEVWSGVTSASRIAHATGNNNLTG